MHAVVPESANKIQAAHTFNVAIPMAIHTVRPCRKVAMRRLAHLATSQRVQRGSDLIGI